MKNIKATTIKKLAYTCSVISFLGCLIFISLKSYSQQNLIGTKKLYSESAIDSIIYAFEDSATGQIVSIYNNFKGIEEIAEGHYKGIQTIKSDEGIIFDNGHKVSFDQKEAFLCYHGHAIYTRVIVSDNSYIVRKYEIGVGKTKMVLEKNFAGGFESQLYPLENSDSFIETDNFEKYGTHFTIYSNNLDSVASYIPKDGFQEASFACNGTTILLFIVPYKENESNKLVFLNAKTGRVNSQKELKSSNSFAQFIIPVHNDYILKMSDDKLIAVNVQGIIKWEKDEINLDANQLPDKNNIIKSLDESELYLITSTHKIVALNSSNGNIKWERNWSDFNFAGNYSDNTTILDFKFINKLDEIMIIFGDLEKTNNGLYKIKRSRVNLISSNGIITAKDYYKDGGINIRLVESRRSKGYYLINNNKISKYEKAN